MTIPRSTLLIASLLFLLPPPSTADRLITEDGRVINLVKARETEDGYTLTFKAGELKVGPSAGIASIEIEGNMEDYEPQNDDERDKLAKGFIRYHGKWMSKSRYEGTLKKEFEASRDRTANLEAHSDWHNAWEIETRHFILRSNTSEEILEYYGNLLEAYYSLMNKRIGIKPTLSYKRKKMTVNIYKSHDEFIELSAAGVGRSTLGYFWSADDTLNFFQDYSDPTRTEWVALHECTHLLTFLVDQQYKAQIWLNEAVADYYGSSLIEVDKRGKIKITPGLLQTDRILTVQQAFEDDDYTRLKDLFFMSRQAYNGFHYAHGWSLVYFFYNYDDGKNAKAFTKFFKDLYTLKKGTPYTSEPGPGPTGTAMVVSPEDIQKLLLKATGYESVPELEKDWKAYIAAIPIESGPALLKRGLQRTRQGKFDEGIKDLDDAIASGVIDARAWAARGLAKAMKGNYGAGKEDLGRALELSPLNAEMHYSLSMLHCGVAIPLGFSISLDGDRTSEEGKLHAGFAAELDPDNENYKDWLNQFK